MTTIIRPMLLVAVFLLATPRALALSNGCCEFTNGTCSGTVNSAECSAASGTFFANRTCRLTTGACVVGCPTMSEWGLVLMAGLLCLAGSWTLTKASKPLNL